MPVVLKTVLPPLLMTIFGLIIIYVIPDQITGDPTSRVDSRTFPHGLAIAIVFLSLISVVEAIVKVRSFSTEGSQSHSIDKSEVASLKRYFIVFAVFVAMLLWVGTLNYTGFVINTYLLTLFLMLLLGNRNKWHIIAIPLLFTVILYYIANTVLRIHLPSGIFL